MNDIRRNVNGADTVLFDFDGVLFRTIEDHFVSWNHAFGQIGREVRWEDFAVLEGQNFYTIARQLGELYRVSDSDMEKIARLKNEYYFQNHRPEPYPDALAVIERLRQAGRSLAVVTGAYRERIDASLTDDWRSCFETIITADDVQKTKPDPEPYLNGAKKLGKAPSQCIVIENAPLGIQSAVAAGMYCIALTTTLSATYLDKAHYITPNLTEACKHILERP